MTILSGPELVDRPEVHYVAFRDRVPFRGLASHTEAMHAELDRWVSGHSFDTVGPQFLRLHVIDLSERVTVSVAVPVATADIAAEVAEAAEDDRIVADVVPAGRYATLTFQDHAIKANLALTKWCADQGYEIARLRDDTGNTFVARLETLLTDPQLEPHPARRHVRLDFKLAN